MDPTPLSPPTEQIEIACPRCGESATVRLYGPCDVCREALRASMGGERREVAAEDYVPKMNVTPNAVALKD